MYRSIALMLAIVFSLGAVASQAREASISNLAWLDRNQMEQQQARIDELARTRLGSRLRGDKSDLETLQEIIDRELIARDDRLTLQALGVVLGNVMAREVEQLQWQVYEDDKGRSKALCLKEEKECLFPVTMLSRRMEAGLKPNVNKVYRDALSLVAPYLPKAPYGGG